jgi:hypothetical protein
MPKLKHPDWCAVLALTGLSAALWAPRLAGPIDLRWDAGVYYLLGTSLAEGKGYRLLNEPGEAQAVQYPPLLPALVAVHQQLLDTSDPARVGPWLRLTFCLISTAAVVAAYGMARGFLRPAYAFCVGALTALNAYGIFISDALFAEIPFVLVALLFVIFNRRSGAALFSPSAALAGIAAYLLRTAGLALLAAWVGESLCRRRWKQALVRAAVTVVPVAAWQAYLGWVTSGQEYRHPAYPYQRAPYQFYNVPYLENISLSDPLHPELGRLSWGGAAVRVVENLASIPYVFGEAASTLEASWSLALSRGVAFLGGDGCLPRHGTAYLIWFLGGLVLMGLGLLAWRREWLLILFVAGTTALTCLTPWPEQFNRYMIPLAPFLSLALVLAVFRVREFTSRHGPRVVRPLGRIAPGAALAGILTADAYGAQFLLREAHRSGTGLICYDPAWGEYDAALDWLKEQAKPGEVIATWGPHRTFLRTGRQAVMPPMERDPAQAQQLLDAVPAAYLIVDDLVPRDTLDNYTRPVLDRNPARWQRVYASTDGKTCIYRRRS